MQNMNTFTFINHILPGVIGLCEHNLDSEFKPEFKEQSL